MTATTGRTVLVIFAILSLVLALLAVARPVLADHSTGEHLSNAPVDGFSWDDEGQNANCPEEDLARLEEGQVLWHFVLTDPAASSGQLWIELENDGILGPYANEGNSQGTLQWFVITDGPDTLLDAWTDVTGGNLVLSHICNTIVEEGSIVIAKVDDNQQPLAGADFQILDSTDAVVATITDAPAWICVDELAFGDYKVVETDAPFGYEKDDSVRNVSVNTISTCEDREGDAADVTFTNVQLLGSIVVHKVDADTEGLLAGAVFDASGPINGTMTEVSDGVHCIDGLPFGDYTVTETSPPTNYHTDPDGPETVSVSAESTCDDAGRLDSPDEVFANEEMLGSVLVHKTDAETDALVGGAVFTIKLDGSMEAGVALTEVADGVHCIDGLSFGDYVVTEADEPAGYLAADPDFQPITVGSESTCDEARVAGAADLRFENEAEEDLGGLTITKIVDCEDCATFTRGRYFNSGQGGGTFDTDQLFDADSGGAISIPGTGYSFANAAEVEAYIDSNVDDGQTEQAVVQYLTTVLNIRYNDEFNEGCDLGSQIYTGSVEAFTAEPTTVDEILDAAAATLAGGTTHTLGDVTTALDEINNSGGDGEGADDVLACAGGNGGSGLEGVTFELYLDDGDVAGELDDSDTEITDDDAFVTGEGGVLTITGLEAGDYFLVEVDRPAECGELDEPIVFGPFTVVGGETTVVEDPLINECDVPEQPGDLGSITIIKNAVPDDAQDFEFTVTGTGLVDFSLDDDADGTLSNQRTFGDLAPGSYTVTEEATTGWTLTSLTCSAGGSVNLAGRTATITIAGSENVTCTFVNTLDTQEAELGSITIIKNAVPDAAQDFVFTTTVTGLASFSLDDDADAALSNQRTIGDLAPGSYTVTESATTGWTLTSITCSAGGSVNLAGRAATITIAGSENVTCTFVNTRQGEGTQPSGGGPTVTPREGTLAGNPLPNTAATPAPGGSLPAILLALIALGALAVGGQRMAAEARSRR